MTIARGSKARLQMYEESTFGTAGANAVFLPATDVALGLTQGLITNDVLTGTRNPTTPELDEKTVGGGFGLQPDVLSIGWVLKHLLGVPVTSGPVTLKYTHVFKIGSLPTSVTLEKVFTDLTVALQYVGCRFNSISFDVGTGGMLKVTVDVIGQDEQGGAGAALDATPLTHPVAPFRLPIVLLEEATYGSPLAAFTSATRFSVTITNNLDAQRVVGGGGIISELPEAMAGVTGSMTIQFRDMAMYTKAKAGTIGKLRLTFPAASAGDSLMLDFPEVRYSVSPVAISGPGGVTTDLNFVAFWQNGVDASAVVATLVNTYASYASIP